ncbi:MAG TPA: hypothetical protein VKU84_13020, partial [Stellaceae bacterium]|nr:hypothetical protein [Stellaceae bacterium]
MSSRAGSGLHLILSAVAALTVLMVTYPVVSVVWRSLSRDDIGSEITLQWIAALFRSPRSRDAILNTVVYSAGSSALAMAIGVALAFVSVRTDMPGGRWIGVLALLPMLVPPFILVIGWIAIADPNAGMVNILVSRLAGSKVTLVDVNGMAGIIWITGLFLAPYVYLLVAAGLANGDT